jgi:hypothetical protein
MFIRGSTLLFTSILAYGFSPDFSLPTLCPRSSCQTSVVSMQFAPSLVFTSKNSVAIVAAKLLHAQDPNNKAQLCLAVWKLTSQADLALSILLDSLGDDSCEVIIVASALGKMGPAAYPAVPNLLQLLSKDDWEIRASVARALGRIGHPSAIPDLIALFRDDNPIVVASARFALHKIGNKSIPYIVAQLKSRDSRIKLEAIKTLGLYRGQPRKVLPFLLPLLYNDEFGVKDEAVRSINKLSCDSEQ